MFKKINKINSKRILIVSGLFSMISLFLVVRLYFLLIHPSKIVSGDIENYQYETIAQNKYKVLDTNGMDLTKYNKKYILVLDTKPFMLNNYEETLEDLMALNFIMKSEDAEFNYSDIMKENGKIYYAISEETYEKVNKLKNIKGIYTYTFNEVDAKEAWKTNIFLSNINDDNIIENSLESDLNNYLKDNSYPASKFYLNDKAVYSKGEEVSENNNNIKLTIDSNIEDKIRDILNKSDYEFLKNVGVVLSEASTGKIRAMVQKDESKANVNLGIGTIGYEPGSIFKVLTEAIGLDLGKISSSSVFTCEGKICTKLGEQYAHGDLTVDEALQVSCNDIFAKVGELSGYENMIEYTEKLGLYQKILGLSGENKEEAAGVKATYEDGVSNFSIGQCVTVTPLQIAGAINAVVNDGVYIKPTIIDSIIDNDDNEVEHIEVEGKRVFSETTAKIVQDSMTNVIWKGTGYEAKVEGITQGGKTGTSTGEGGKTNHGWFAGYFEMDGKKYTLLVVAPNIGDNHPDGRELGGGNTGAPIFRQIINSLISNN